MNKVYAHVKWFVEEAAPADKHSVFGQTAANVWSVVALGMLAVAWILNRVLPAPPKWLTEQIASRKRLWLRAVQLLIGISLLIASFNGYILVPHLAAGAGLDAALLMVQFTTAFVLIATIFPFAAGALLIFLFLATGVRFGLTSGLEYINFLGIAVFLVLIGRTKPEENWEEKALPTLRILTGAALIVLALTEKLLNPGPAVELAGMYGLNFMSAIGVTAFSDELFVISAGFMELVFGTLLVLGWVTRLNTLALAGFLVASNLYFFAAGFMNEGWIELVGHLPVLAAGLILVIYGSGRKHV